MLRAASIALLCLLQTPLLSGQTAGRPAYNVVLINSSVDVFTIELPPHSHSQLRQNVHDVILIALEASDLTVVNKEKQRDQLQFNDGDVRVLPSYTVDSLLNETGRDFRGVVVELKSRGLEPTGCGCSGKIERAICGCEPQHLPELWPVLHGRDSSR